MSETVINNNSNANDAAKSPKSNFVNTLLEVGATWAETGIGFGRVALTSSAHALERTAKALLELEGKLRRDAKPEDTSQPTNGQAS